MVACRPGSTYRARARTVTRSILRRGGPGKLAAAALLLAIVGPAQGRPEGPPAAGPSASAPAPPAPRASARPPTPSKRPRLDPAALSADLARPGTIASALASIRDAGPAAKALAPPVEALLSRGLPPELAIDAIGALAAVGSRSSSEAIVPYMSHRSAAVRRAAAQALASTRGPEAASALAAGLRSTDAEVRRLSAIGLRDAGDSSAVPDLVRALDRGELDAAPALAALCPAAACGELLARWELVNRLDAGAPGAEKDMLEALLSRRPPLPDELLVAAVEKVAASTSAASRAYLSSMKRPPRASPRVRKALEASARAVRGGGR